MELFKILNEEGQTIVMVTHNPKNVPFSSRTLLLKNGKIESNLT